MKPDLKIRELMAVPAEAHDVAWWGAAINCTGTYAKPQQPYLCIVWEPHTSACKPRSKPLCKTPCKTVQFRKELPRTGYP